jgi:hypothetical protein
MDAAPPIQGGAQQPAWALPAGFSLDRAANAPRSQLTPAKAEELPPEGPQDTGWTGALTGGLSAAIRGPAQTVQALRGQAPTEQAPIAAAQPIELSDLANPSLLGKKMLYGIASNVPEMAGFIGGSALAGGPETPAGLVAGGLGAAVVNAAKSFGPEFGKELKATPNDPDGAFNRAWKSTAVGSAFTGAGFAAFGIAPFEGALKNLMFQAFGVQQVVGAGETAAQNVLAGKPVTEGMAQQIPSTALMTVVPALPFAAIHARGAPEVAPGAERPAEVPPAVRTPEEIENQDGVGPETAQRIHDAEAAKQPAAAAATTVPAERADAAARQDLAAAVSPAQQQLADTLRASAQRQPTPPVTRPPEEAASAPAPTLPAPQPIAAPDFIPGWKPPTLGPEPAPVPAAAPTVAPETPTPIPRPPPVGRPDPGTSLLQFLKQRGGLQPDGDLRAMDAHIASPGLIRKKTGLTLDYAREAAAEAGFLPHDSTPADLLNLISEELKGRKQYGHHMPEQIVPGVDTTGREEARREAVMEDVRMAADDAGLTLSGATLDHATDLAARGMRAEDAVQEAHRFANEVGGEEPIPFERKPPLPPQSGAPLLGVPEREQAASMQRAPTIRNDTRQVDMFGRSDAAVQAQAARDQAGRGALLPGVEQRAADEGLFARRETPQPELPAAQADRATKQARLKEIGQLTAPFAKKEYLTSEEGRQYEALAKEANGLRFDLNRPLTLDRVLADEKSTLSPEVVVAAHNDLYANRAGYDAISSAVASAHFDAETAVDRVMAGRNPDISAADLYHQFDQTRAALRAQYGDTVTLYRAEGKQRQKATTNWATTRAFAEQFGKNVVERQVPIDHIIAVNVPGRGRYHEVIVGEQPAPPVKSQWKTDKDTLADVPPHTPENVHQVAADWVFQKGRETGHEHFAVVDNATGRITSAGTSGRANRIILDLKDLDATPDGSVTFYHNHPQSSSFSVDDLAMGAHRAISHMVAIGHDGTVYTASVTKLARAVTSPMNFMRLAYNSAYYRTKLALQRAINSGQIVADEGNRSFYDMAARLLAARGIIDYVSSHNPTDVVRGIIRSTIEGMGVKPDVAGRFTQSVRSDEGIAGLPRAVAGETRGEPARAGPPTEARPAGTSGTQQGRLLEPPAGVAEAQDQFPLGKPPPVKDENDFRARMARLPLIGGALDRAAAGFTDFGHTIQMMATPMAHGSDEARAMAKDFANMRRLHRDETGRMVEWLTKQFSPAELKDMWERADAESVARQMGKDPTGYGLDQLTPRQRQAVEQLQNNASRSLALAKRMGMFQGEELPSYVPRMATGIGTDDPHVVRDIRTLAIATGKLNEAIAGRRLIEGVRQAGLRVGMTTVRDGTIPAGGGEPMNPFGTNLRTTTPQLLHREHMTVEQQEEAMRKMPVGEDGFRYFTIKENPAFWTSRVIGTDAEGKPIWGRVPVFVRSDFEGPLRAVLTKPDGMVYRGMMDLKGRMMTSIMYGVSHLGVIMGRALPATRYGNIVGLMREGYVAKTDPAIRNRGIRNGVAPIDRRFSQYGEIGDLERPPDLTPGRSWTAQLIGAIPGVFSKTAGDATKRAIDRLGDFMHNTLLWDRVADIQWGLFTSYERYLTNKGVDPQSAARAAAHFANRYSGSLPNEAMSQGARKILNSVLFSRSYRAGNAGAIKDAVVGLPRDSQAQILRDKGAQALEKVNSLAQRKAISTLAIDMALYYAGNSVLQSAANVMMGDSTLDDEAKGYLRRLTEEGGRVLSNPLRALNPFGVMQALTPMGEHEPGKQNRILMGYEKDGTGIYVRNPFGKYAEDISDYFTQPNATLHSMLSPFMRPINAVWTNDVGFGHKLYDPNADTPGKVADNIKEVLLDTIEGATPKTAIQAAQKLATGQGGAYEAAQIAGGGLGFSVSHGYPGGPGKGEAALVKDQQSYAQQKAMPGIRDKIRAGDVDGARADMNALNMPVWLQRYEIIQTQNPHMTPRQTQQFFRAATPEQKAAMERLQRSGP